MNDFQTVDRVPEPLRPESRFMLAGQPASFSILDFWVWVGSDVLNNALRGKVAEYIVGQAVGAWADALVRVEWDTVDIRTPEGITIEVKSAAYIQSWRQSRPSAISFDVAKKIPWNPETGEYGEIRVRSANVYVFCVLSHRDLGTIDPLELTQWTFYVVPTRTLDDMLGDQKTVRLSRLRDLGVVPVRYCRLRAAIHEAYDEGVRN